MKDKSEPKRYTKLCPLLTLFKEHGARHSRGDATQEQNKRDQRDLIEKLVGSYPQRFVILTPDGEHHASLEAFVWNSKDSLLTLVINDNNGHTVVVQDQESLGEFDEEMETDGLWLGAPTEYKRRLDNVYKKYGLKGGMLDSFAMARRLAEFGEGD